MHASFHMLKHSYCWIGLVFIVGCASHPNPEPPQATPAPVAPEPKKEATPIKNIILLIGDGMGPQQIGLLQEYAHRAPNSIYQGRTTAIEDFMEAGVIGMSRNGPMDRLVVDSACSATQLSTGVAAPSEVIGLDAEGNPAKTLLERAKQQGKATGLISDTRLTHATPASFAAHAAHRNMENAIAVQMLNTGADVMLSGGLRHWIPKAANDKEGDIHKALKAQTGGNIRIKSKRKDERNLLDEARQAGYDVVFQRNTLKKATGSKLLGLFSYSEMMNGITNTQTANDPKRSQPSLEEMTVKALDVLSRDPDGFFLMVEGGLIDWAGHANDAGTMLHEMIKFDAAIRAIYNWVQQRDDTLVIITADHETGGFGFSYSRRNVPEARKLPGSGFADRDYKPNWNYGLLSGLDGLYNQKKSLHDMIGEFKKLDKAKQTPESLAAIVNRNTDFTLSIEGAKSVLASEPNAYYVKGHKYLDAKVFPKFNDFEEYYVLGENGRSNLIGRALAAQQNIVWATGSHTHTPVTVIAYGPNTLTAPFGRLLHHTQLGQLMAEALTKTP